MSDKQGTSKLVDTGRVKAETNAVAGTSTKDVFKKLLPCRVKRLKVAVLRAVVVAVESLGEAVESTFDS